MLRAPRLAPGRRACPTSPLAIERSKDISHMSRFAIRDMGTTVAAGLCLDIEER